IPPDRKRSRRGAQSNQAPTLIGCKFLKINSLKTTGKSSYPVFSASLHQQEEANYAGRRTTRQANLNKLFQ
ncbi:MULTISPECIES: hypothetical protein, partial [unclassified Paraburkholderia]|uniref:hypothetical protein n=1 Tax=unclassified Paraburkholderia TaxID=2615204 RepID=UPI002AB165F9